MKKITLSEAIAFGNAAFTKADRAEAMYVRIVEKLYELGENVAQRLEAPERVADPLLEAARVHIQQRNGYRLAEKALSTACRIYASVCPPDNRRLTTAYKLLGHVCCRQGKHGQALKFNTLAALYMMRVQRPTSSECKDAKRSLFPR